MYSLYPKFVTITLLFTVAAAPGCDSVDEGYALDPADGDLLAGVEPGDEEAEHDTAVLLDDLAGHPISSYWDCPASASFCFWHQIQYGGFPLALPKGDFAIKDFGVPIKSMLKRNGTYRVKLFSKPNFQGNCAVFGPADKSAQSPNIAFEVRSARRMEPGDGGCSP